MSERDLILIDLVREVLGPREGPEEILPADQDPRDEYITGVLAPEHDTTPEESIESEVEEVVEEISGEDDQQIQGDEDDQDARGRMVVPGVLAPALDPKSLPRSIGLSVTLTSRESTPEVEICASWARYRQHAQGWHRQPASFLTGPVPATSSRQWEAAEDVSLQMRGRQLQDGTWRVSLFLVNVGTALGDRRPEVAEHLFQPQIRVSCCAGTTLVPVRTSRRDSPDNTPPGSLAFEDASLDLLYRERAALARGHLCGVTWKDIDPERPHHTLSSPDAAPFAWTDAATVSERERAKFSPADVRTDMTPCYPLEAPSMDWDGVMSPSPELDPEVLAETWQAEQLEARLRPLVAAYRVWIGEQEALAEGLPPEQQHVARSNMQECREAADRMDQALGILAEDEDVRLAFCFANRAIALQSQWTRGRAITWRPFQIAFILLNIAALADPTHRDRRICDLLWFPTGGGKTEAYLGLTAFTLALRRRRSIGQGHSPHAGAGTGVLSRYTLRLLTIQQFRRALGLITACEVLRVYGLDSPGSPVGWRPCGCSLQETFLWGGIRFSVGLWVGGGVTPNSLLSNDFRNNQGRLVRLVGALEILQGGRYGYDGPNRVLRRNLQGKRLETGGEPAQILTCPCCGTPLAVSDKGLPPGQHTLHFIFQGGRDTAPPLSQLRGAPGAVVPDAAGITVHDRAEYRTLSLTFTVPPDNALTAEGVDQWWNRIISPALGRDVELLAARPARPGYFLLTYENTQGRAVDSGFEIYCPDPSCGLNQHAWAEQVPLPRTAREAPSGRHGGVSSGVQATARTAELPVTPGRQWQQTPKWGRRERMPWVSNRIPVPAMTVDDQVYHGCPSLVISTVDKFARLAYEPKAGALFGNVTHYHSRWGYYREGAPPSWGNLPGSFTPHPRGFARGHPLHTGVAPFQPPDLILQDELHLIEGPLGSMVGLYESAIELLCRRQHDGDGVILPKYIASTATVRQAESQVQALFDRRLAQFPPSAVSADDRFFSRDREIHPLESERPGRLYVAMCAPGKGAQTPIVRIWSSLSQSAHERLLAGHVSEIDQFYTLVGYFNAIRELAGALSLYRQDIPERISFRAGDDARPLDRSLELSSRADSLELPNLLSRLEERAPDAEDAVFATSMFGTGVDVDRLGLMVVHGQPKTTASYIQATGRVGRQSGGLVVSFFRASRPRDLDHYEFFTGYHRGLYRYVEPITVAPFSPRARERALGPLAVVLLRQAGTIGGQAVDPEWLIQQRISGGYFTRARRMSSHRHDPEVSAIPELFGRRADRQPAGRIPPPGVTAREVESELDRWKSLADRHPHDDRFVYYEYSVTQPPSRDVVLGDAHHRAQNLGEAYENAPQSLRDVEETTGFKT